ncbi:SDR family NAD(P)-dependent oxidoreductase [Novispirillum itersonii]|uniref:NAD(P)-dependent dehydrogenase (Short-subunit alcohol dehydrogenase family) n=1 Tax=Novispirillum itersonii TaxID=189 RepID=A0A7W9ZGU1_NOVIT|nr:SDR family NAD(P)-dependent oxidoreductase [Novispirillum itersonii]MBB6211241.1 NAD(P)-dependent dehydrogenase (short-subunit alcohol dehydrogenase family) [Novispirillum itersonii]
MAVIQSRRLALVNGAGTAIGQAIAAGLAHRGVAVLLAGDRPSGRHDPVAPGEVRPFRLDLARPDSVQALADWIRDIHGPLDGLIHQALPLGLVPGQGDRDRLRAEVVVLTEALIPLLAASGQGRMVILTSRAGCAQPLVAEKAPDPGIRTVAAALNGLTRHYAQALREQGIKVNAVCPEEGVQAAIHMAMLDEDGPSGSLTDDLGELPW